MADLIDRDAAIDALCSVCGVDCDKSKFVYGGKQEDQVILCPEHYALTQLSSTQPERKKGKWLIADDIPSICSNCGTNWINDYVDSRELYFTGKIPNYCPNCGSDNRGEQDDTD